MMQIVIGNILKQDNGGAGVSIDWYCRRVTRNTLWSLDYDFQVCYCYNGIVLVLYDADVPGVHGVIR